MPLHDDDYADCPAARQDIFRRGVTPIRREHDPDGCTYRRRHFIASHHLTHGPRGAINQSTAPFRIPSGHKRTRILGTHNSRL